MSVQYCLVSVSIPVSSQMEEFNFQEYKYNLIGKHKTLLIRQYENTSIHVVSEQHF